MGLRGEAAIVGFHELPCERKPSGTPEFTIEQWARLAAAAVADAGLRVDQVDGLVTTGVFESEIFVPSTVAEYLGLQVNFLTPMNPTRLPNMGDALHFGASSFRYGSPQAEFEIPYGYLGQNGPYAQVAQMYAAAYGYDERAMAKIVVDQRVNANHTPGAVFKDKPITIEDVLGSPIIASPLHMLARQSKNRPVWIRGFGERVPYKSPVYAQDPLHTPMLDIAPKAFGMAGLTTADMDMVSIYDCYTITALLTLEDAGFCEKGKGMQFVTGHDLTFRGDFPMNTAGGQLGYGQPGNAGGMHHVCDAARQLMGRAGETQVADCNRAFVSGNGGVLSEQEALILVGD